MGPNPAIIIANFHVLAQIMQSISIIMGIALMVGALFQLKRYGEMRTFMSHQMTIWTPLVMMVAGVILLCLPTIVATALQSFWGTYTPLHYEGFGLAGMAGYANVVIVFMRLVGIGAFMRGVVMLSRAGGHSSQPGTLGRAMIHILGGILLIHVLGTYNLVKTILDISTV